jgi:hypothetical protein
VPLRRPRLRPSYTLVLSLYALFVALIGLRAVDLLPDPVLLLYVPAVAAALLVDAFLHNGLGVSTSLYYPLVVLFALPYAVVVIVVGRWLAARLDG